MKNLKLLVDRAVKELNEIGIQTGNIIDIETAPVSRKYWGQCRRTAYGFVIKINEGLLNDDIDDKATMDTIMHEVIHTVNNCFDHKSGFKKVATLVNHKYGYNVKRTTTAAEKGIEKTNIIKYKYTIKCVNCGASTGYARKSKAVKSIENKEGRYYCNKCGSYHLVVE